MLLNQLFPVLTFFDIKYTKEIKCTGDEFGYFLRAINHLVPRVTLLFDGFQNHQQA